MEPPQMTSNLELVFLTKFIILFITEEFVQMFRFVGFGVICWNCTNSAPAEQISKTGGVFFYCWKDKCIRSQCILGNFCSWGLQRCWHNSSTPQAPANFSLADKLSRNDEGWSFPWVNPCLTLWAGDPYDEVDDPDVAFGGGVVKRGGTAAVPRVQVTRLTLQCRDVALQSPL